jgi:hypothetical protein
MSEKTFDYGVVSWQMFDALFEQQYDFCRKLRFFIKGGRANKEEAMALDVIEDLLNRKEQELEELREKGLADRDNAGGTGVTVSRGMKEGIPDRNLLQHEDQAVFKKLMNICKTGGYSWEYLKTVIDNAYSNLEDKEQTGT